MNDNTFDRIIRMLEATATPYRLVEHEVTRTSEESARGEELRVGGKALVVKADSGFHLAVLSADRKLDSRALEKCLGTRKLRFATTEELAEATALLPGSVPPFGAPILPFDLFVDRSVLRNDRIAFNAGSLQKSIIMSTDDYIRLSQPTIAEFSKEGRDVSRRPRLARDAVVLLPACGDGPQ